MKRLFFSILLPTCFHCMEPEHKINYQDMPPIRRRESIEDGFSKSTQEALSEYLDKKSQQKENPLNISTDSEDSIPKRHHHKRMLLSNGVTALLATCVTAGVTLAIHFSNCNK